MKIGVIILSIATILALFFLRAKNTQGKKSPLPEERVQTNHSSNPPSLSPSQNTLIAKSEQEKIIPALSKPNLTRLDLEEILLPALKKNHASILFLLANSEAPIDYETIGGILYHYFSSIGKWSDHEEWLTLASKHTELGNYFIPTAILAWSNENQEAAESFIFNNKEGAGIISAAKVTARKTTGLGVPHSAESLNEKLDPSHPVDQAYLKGVFEGLIYFDEEGTETLTKKLSNTPLGDYAIISYLEASKPLGSKAVEWTEQIKDERLRKITLIDTALEWRKIDPTGFSAWLSVSPWLSDPEIRESLNPN